MSEKPRDTVNVETAMARHANHVIETVQTALERDDRHALDHRHRDDQTEAEQEDIYERLLGRLMDAEESYRQASDYAGQCRRLGIEGRAHAAALLEFRADLAAAERKYFAEQ